MIVAKPGFRLPFSTYLNNGGRNLLFPSHQTTGITHVAICFYVKPFLCDELWIRDDIHSDNRNITCLECQKRYLALKKI